ncbi:hypothetical protein V6N11_071784 [Hibiscus sabdariffa]|uniref:Secreted protein n=1 Tax=Hibiscus sabdariffa TaxID=183260 RepID=A0ABR2U124_9ROSI
MWFLLWLAWCWFVTPSRSVDARCGQLRFRCHVLPSSTGVSKPLAALLADFGDAGFRCRFPCDALWLFRSHALLVSQRSSPTFYCPCGYVLVARSTPSPALLLGLAWCVSSAVLALTRFDSWLEDVGLLVHSPVVHPNMPGLVRGIRLCVPPLLGLSVYGCSRTQVPPLLGPSVLGDSRSQGCAAKAHCAVCLCAAKAPRAGSVCAVLGGSCNLGCAAKAHRAVYGPYAASAPCAGLCAPLALAGDLRPICGLRLS